MYSEYESIFNSFQQNDFDLYDLNRIFNEIRNYKPSILRNCSVEIIEQALNNYDVNRNCYYSAKDIRNFMNIICESFNLPLSKHILIEKCVNLYSDWLIWMYFVNSEIPYFVHVLHEDRNYLTATILSHFMRLFKSRKGEGIEFVKYQETLCNKILNLIKRIARESNILHHEIWEYFLIFIMSVNRQLLTPLTLGNDIADHLCDNLLTALFEIWLLACASHFPPPSFWKSFNETCINLRHRLSLIEQWNRINFALASRLLSFLYGNTYPGVKITNETNLIPSSMSNDCIAQSWYRFLCCIGNPVDLCKPEIIFKTIIYYKMITEDKLIKYLMEHPTLKSFPLIYWKAMEGITKQINAFLGFSFDNQTQKKINLTEKTESHLNDRNKDNSKPAQWFLFSTQDSLDSSITRRPSMDFPTFSLISIDNNIPNEYRSHCDSIFHLFGKILFEASFLNRGIYLDETQKRSSYSQKSIHYYQNIHNPLFEYFDAGQAEVIGAICRILCSKKVSEDILTVYLSRSYLSLTYSIKLAQAHTFINGDRLLSNSLATILLNSSDFFRLNLKGIDVLFSCFVEALESVFNETVNFRTPDSKNMVRKSAIHLLMSMIIRPIALCNLKILDFLTNEIIKYEHFKWKIYDILVNALDKERFPTNTIMLLNGILLYLEELMIFQRNSTLYRTVERSVSEVFLDINLKVTNNLVTIWKSDLMVSLSALEFLSGLAHIKIPDYEQYNFDKETVRHLCEYVIYQCSRSPLAHSKDLHSTIVSAFYCCITWLTEYPRILEDKEYFHIIMEIVELGISGTKSVDRINSNMCMKHEKDLKPVSLRVKDAAEYLLNCILEQIGHYPLTGGVDSLSSLMDEMSLLKQFNKYAGTLINRKNAIDKFQYFILDSSTIIALLDEPLGNDQDSKPVITILIRNAFSRFAWTMQLRHIPRYGSTSKYYNSMPGRPVSMTNAILKMNFKPKYYPDYIDKLAPCEIDLSIPNLECISRSDPFEFNEITKIAQLIEKQHNFEKKLLDDCDLKRIHNFECLPPKGCLEYQTIRLFLANFNLLPLSLDKKNNPCDNKLKTLYSNSIMFCNDLEILDAINSRIFDTVYLFYVPKGAKTVTDILSKTNLDQKIFDKFTDFIKTLGSTVLIENHIGWTGNIQTSWKTTVTDKIPYQIKIENICNLADGFSNILYWSDAVCEIAFICPSLDSIDNCNLNEKSNKALLKNTFLNEINLRNLSMSQSNAKFFLVWLERFEDYQYFPIDKLTNYTKTGLEINKTPEVVVIFVYLMETGLARIHVQSPSDRLHYVIPLINDIVLSKNTFSFMIRQYVLNVSKRQRLHNDSYQTPHVRRRIKIQEILQKYNNDMTIPELLTYLFQKS